MIKSSPQVAEDFSEFNRVSETTNLSQKNVDYLLKQAVKLNLGINDEKYETLNRSSVFNIVAIGEEEDLKNNLTEAILAFLGRDPYAQPLLLMVKRKEIRIGPHCI
jgi:hypothetical protein